MNAGSFNAPFEATIKMIYGPALWPIWSQSPLLDYDLQTALQETLARKSEIGQTIWANIPFEKFRVIFHLGRGITPVFVRVFDSELLEFFWHGVNENSDRPFGLVFRSVVTIPDRTLLEWSVYDPNTAKIVQLEDGTIKADHLEVAMQQVTGQILCGLTVMALDERPWVTFIPSNQGKSSE